MKWCKSHRTLRTRSVFSAVVIVIFRLKSLFATLANGDLSRNIAFTTAENAHRVRSVRGHWVRSNSTNFQQCTNVILNRPLERVCLRVLLIISYMTSNICVCWQINLSLLKMFIFPQPIFPPTSCHGQMIDIFFLSGLMSGLHETYALGAERRRLLKRHRTSGPSFNHQERLLAFENSESPVIEKKREVLLRWLTSCLLSSLDQPSVLVLDTAPCHSMLTEESRWSGERPYDWRGVGWWCSLFFSWLYLRPVFEE